MTLPPLFQRQHKLLTTNQRLKQVKSKFLAFLIIFSSIIIAIIIVFAIEFNRVSHLTYDSIAEERIKNTGYQRSSLVNYYLKNSFLDMETFTTIVDNADITDSNGDIVDEKLYQLLDNKNVPRSIEDSGIIYNGKAIFRSDYSFDLKDDFHTITNNSLYTDVDIKQGDNIKNETVYFLIPAPLNTTHPQITGYIGKFCYEHFDELVSTPIYNQESTTLIVRKNGDIIYYTSMVHKWRFDGTGPYGWPEFTNLSIAMRDYWVSSTDYNRYVEFMENDEAIIFNAGEDDRDGMFYKAILSYGDEDNPIYLIFMAPKAYLITKTETLTKIAVSCFYSSLVISAISIILLTLLILIQFVKKKKIESFDFETGLHHENAFYHDTQAVLLQHPKNQFGLVHVNIQNFKRINASFGSETGDIIIKQVGALLQSKMEGEPNELAGYQHGVGFMILLEGNQDDILYKLNDLNYSLTNKHYEYEQKLSFSYGIKMTDSQYSLDLHTEFDHAKHANQNRKKDVIYTFYDDNMVKMQKEQDDLNGRFEEALANEEFEVFLQLKWDLKKNDWAGAEALCRWRDPIKGLISPGKFIPLFEQNGRIVKLDEYMFEQTCKIISKMMANGERCVPVSFNLSKRNFQDLSFIDRYQEIIEKYNIPHELIEIEITEGLLVDNVEAFTSFIKIFHENDFHISMDDFGTGYSSLNMIHQLDFDVIKIDAKFFRGGFDEANQTIVSSIIKLCHKLNKLVVAEGVEQANEVEFLKDAECDIIQGYYFAKPLPVEEFKALLFSKPENK